MATFGCLKRLFIPTPVLTHPDPSRQFIVEVASPIPAGPWQSDPCAFLFFFFLSFLSGHSTNLTRPGYLPTQPSVFSRLCQVSGAPVRALTCHPGFNHTTNNDSGGPPCPMTPRPLCQPVLSMTLTRPPTNLRLACGTLYPSQIDPGLTLLWLCHWTTSTILTIVDRFF